MNTTVEKVVVDAMRLPPSARAFVAEKLIESLDVSGEFVMSEAWRTEIRRRSDEIDRGLVELEDGDVVFARAYAALE